MNGAYYGIGGICLFCKEEGVFLIDLNLYLFIKLKYLEEMWRLTVI